MNPMDAMVYVHGPGDVVWLAGEDRLAFLDRLSTNRLSDLAIGHGRATAILTDSGRVVDLVAAYAGADGVALITSGPGAAASVAEHLRRYVMHRDRVRVTDATPQVAMLRLLGPTATLLAAELSGATAADLAAGRWWRRETPLGEIWGLGQPEPGGLGGVDLVAARGPDVAGLHERLAASGARAISDEDYAATRIDARLPAFGHEIDGRGNPLELGLRAVVDFAKGCYIGQEVVARLDSYAKVQRRLVRLAADKPLTAGMPLRGMDAAAGRQSAMGRVTTAAPAPDGPGWQALALVPAAWAPLSVVRVEAAGGSAAASATILD